MKKKKFHFVFTDYSYPGDELGTLDKNFRKKDERKNLDLFDGLFLYKSELEYVGEMESRRNKIYIAVYNTIDSLYITRTLYIFDNDSDMNMYVSLLREENERMKI